MAQNHLVSKKIFEVIPQVMRVMRTQIRTQKKERLSIPQYRVLSHIYRGAETTSLLAELQSVSLPSMSKLIDGLVRRGFILRTPDSRDRRQVNLKHTKQGRAVFLKVRKAAELGFSETLNDLSVEDFTTLLQALEILKKAMG